MIKIIGVEDVSSIWAGIYCYVGAKLGLSFDRACADRPRAYYSPRYPSSSLEEPNEEYIIWSESRDGYAIDSKNLWSQALNGEFTEFTPRATRHSWKKSANGNQSEYESDNHDFCVELDETHINLLHWIAISKGRFFLASCVEQNSPESILRTTDEGHYDVICPFDDEHTHADQDGFFVIDAQLENGLTAHCNHNVCQSRDQLEFIVRLIEDGRITLDDLKNRDLYDEPEGEEFSIDWNKLNRVFEGLPPHVWPYGFFEKDGYLWFEKTVSGDEKHIKVCQLFRAEAKVHNEKDCDHGVLVSFNGKSGPCEIVLPWHMMQGDAGSVRKLLVNTGLHIRTQKSAKNAFDEVIGDLLPQKTIINVSTPGFHFGGFVTPLGDVVGEPECEIRLDDRRAVKDRNQKGTLKDWKKYVAAPAFHEKTPHFALGILSGFAGTLLAHLNEKSCGISFSGTTSRGKSTAQCLGASVWGNPEPDQGLLVTSRKTTNAMEATAARSHASCLHIDELGQIDKRELGTLVFMLAEGQGKGRMKSDASERHVYSWTTFGTFSGEKGLRSYVEESGNTWVGGMSVRFLDINVSELQEHDPDLVKDHSNNAAEFYGTAGPKFAEFLLRKLSNKNGIEKIKSDINRTIEDILDEQNGGAVDKRAARVLATLCVAGDIAISAGILPEDVDVFEPCLWGWEMYIDSSEGEARDVVNRSISDLRGYIAKHIDAKIIQIGADTISYQGAEGWYGVEFIYIPRSVADMLFSTKATAVCKKLASEGLLVMQGKNYWHSTIPGIAKILPHIRLKKKEFFA